MMLACVIYAKRETSRKSASMQIDIPQDLCIPSWYSMVGSCLSAKAMPKLARKKKEKGKERRKGKKVRERD